MKNTKNPLLPKSHRIKYWDFTLNQTDDGQHGLLSVRLDKEIQ